PVRFSQRALADPWLRREDKYNSNPLQHTAQFVLRTPGTYVDGPRSAAALFRGGARVAPRFRDGAGAQALRLDPQPSGGRRPPEADGKPLPRRDVRALELPAGRPAGRGLSDRPESRGKGRDDVPAR